MLKCEGSFFKKEKIKKHLEETEAVGFSLISIVRPGNFKINKLSDKQINKQTTVLVTFYSVGFFDIYVDLTVLVSGNVFGASTS